MLIDAHNHIGADLFFYLNGFYPYGQDLPALVNEGGRHGVYRWIEFPMVANTWFDPSAMRRGKLEPGGPERVPYAFENERMLREIHELFPDLGRRTLPFVMFDPMREPAAQVARLRELKAQFPFYGLKLQATMIKSDAGALLREGRCILDFAAEHDLPVLMHSSVVANDPWSEAGLLLRIVAAAPEVRFSLAHSVRFDRVYLDRVAELPNAWFDCSAHRIHCMGAAADMSFIAAPARRFAAEYRDPEAVLAALAEAYPHKLVWGSDTPFQSFVAKEADGLISLRSTYAEEIACVRALSSEHQRRVAHENTLAFLRIKDPSALERT